MKALLEKEFSGIKPLNDHPLLVGYEFSDGSRMYFEHAFLTQLENLFNIHKDSIPKIIEEMTRIVKKETKVVFVHDFEHPVVDMKEYILLEITDITDPLQIYVEDKSRGSDYGD